MTLMKVGWYVISENMIESWLAKGTNRSSVNWIESNELINYAWPVVLLVVSDTQFAFQWITNLWTNIIVINSHTNIITCI